jgi:hypothetical protein
MKWCLIIVLGLAATGAFGRTWTSTAGSKIEADYVGFRNNTVSLRKADGKSIQISMQFLSEADRTYVNEQKAQEPAAAPSLNATGNAPSTTTLSGSSGPVRKDLLTEEQIAKLKTELPGKHENDKLVFQTAFTVQQLTPAERRKLKAGQIPYRITAEFLECTIEKGKPVSKRLPGYVRFYVLDDEGTMLVSKRVALEKMCPT